jgi:FixJ family two-component response regulator
VLTKPLQPQLLRQAIDTALARSSAIRQRESQLLDLRSRYASLTARERDVLSLVVTGLLNKQVGGELGITEMTVKAHRGQIMRKMQANSFADLVRMDVVVRFQPSQYLRPIDGTSNPKYREAEVMR